MKNKKWFIRLLAAGLSLAIATSGIAQATAGSVAASPVRVESSSSAGQPQVGQPEAELVSATVTPVRPLMDLGTLGGAMSLPNAINEQRQVVGRSETVTGEVHAFLWEAGMMVDLGTLGGPTSEAFDINEHGQVVGYSKTAVGDTHPFLWQDGVMQDLGSFGGPEGWAWKINERGQIVGFSQTPAGQAHAFLWEAGTMIDLGTLGGNSSGAADINERGQVVGNAEVASGDIHAFLWENGVMHDLGTLGGLTSLAEDINEAGQVVGSSEVPGSRYNYHAFLWAAGGMQDLGGLGGIGTYAEALNNHSQVVGISAPPTDYGHAFLWQNGVMQDLGTLGDTNGFSRASGINERGQIIGYSDTIGANDDAFFWENGIMWDLGTLERSFFSNPTDINKRGDVVGYSETTDGDARAFLTPYVDLWLLFSSSTGGTVGGVSFADEDILAYQSSTGQWIMVFDGSDVGVTDDIDAFAMLADGALVFSLHNAAMIPGLGLVDDSDLIRFTPMSLGRSTTGTLNWYVDGSDIGLTTDGEDIDALSLTADGRLLISTLGNVVVVGAKGADEDLMAFRPSRLGAQTTGSWKVFFDGSDVSLTDTSEDLQGVWFDMRNANLFLSTAGEFRAGGVRGQSADIAVFVARTEFGTRTSGTYRSFWQGAKFGFASEQIDDFEVIDGSLLAVSAVTLAKEPFVPEVGDDLPDDVLDEYTEETTEEPTEEEQVQKLYLPLVQQ